MLHYTKLKYQFIDKCVLLPDRMGNNPKKINPINLDIFENE